MAHSFHHIHLRGYDPGKSAQWYVDMFQAKPLGDRDVRGARSSVVQFGSVTITISGTRPQETLGPADSNPHYGLDHFALSTDDLERDLKRIQERGGKVLQRAEVPAGKIAFIEAPDKVRIELMQMQAG